MEAEKKDLFSAGVEAAGLNGRIRVGVPELTGGVLGVDSYGNLHRWLLFPVSPVARCYGRSFAFERSDAFWRSSPGGVLVADGVKPLGISRLIGFFPGVNSVARSLGLLFFWALSDSTRELLIVKPGRGRYEMYLVEDKGGAIALMLAALFFLGTWPAVLTLLERRGRLPQHTYLDYSITNLLAAVLIALTFGQIGDGKPNMPNFLTQLTQENWPSILFAMAGGVVLSLGNLATQYAWAYVGLSVTEVITSSITVVIGTTMNYFLDDRINRAEILFPGVGFFLIAVCLGSAVHSSNAADNEEKLSGSSCNYKHEKELIEDKKEYAKNNVVTEDLEGGAFYISASNPEADKAKFGTAEFLIELENRRSIKVLGSSTFVGLSLVFFAGVCFSLFSPAFNLATNDQWHTLKEGVPHLVVYTAFFYFSVSCFGIAIALNICFLYIPVLRLPKSSFTAYLNDWKGRHWALLAGLLCGFGNGFQFMGGQAAGYAAADAVQALPLVSTFWGIFLFGEYRKSSKRTYVLLVGMLFMFIIAVAVLMASSGHRKTS